jgi:hypothetical protein
MGAIQAITSCVSLLFTIFAVWFVVREFTKAQREADAHLVFADGSSRFVTGANVKSPITIPLAIANHGFEPAKHISLMIAIEKTWLGNEQTVSSEIRSNIQGVSVEQLNDEPLVILEVHVLYASVFRVGFGEGSICYPRGDTIRFGELILKWDDSKIVERKNISLGVRYKINAEPMKTRQGHLDVRLIMADLFDLDDI